MKKIEFITKRNGEMVEYDFTKIVRAIRKANADPNVPIHHKATEGQIIAVADKVTDKIEDGASVEDVQDAVIDTLQEVGLCKLSREYAKFRYQKESLRQANATDEAILGIIRRTNEEAMNENSNKNAYENSTIRDLAAGEVSKDLTMRMLLPWKIAEAHRKGVLHFHDADYFIQPMFNCCLVDISNMLDNGFVMNGKLIESPKSFQVACTVMTQVIASVASNQYGGQSVAIRHLGKYLRRTYEKAYAKFVTVYGTEMAEQLAKEKMMEDLKNGVQTIQYQINTLMTTNGQSPFVTLFLQIIEGDEYEQEDALIIEEILNQRLTGIKNENGVYITPAFPKLVYVLDEHNALKGGKYDYLTKLAVKCSAKRMYPDYISAKKMREMHDGEVFSCMGCRSFLSEWKDENGNYKWEGRFNQGVVSLNLPQIALVAKGDEMVFWQELEQRLGLCFEALMCRHKALLGTPSDVSPIHWQYGAIARLAKGEPIDKLLKDGYSTISLGYIGIYETVYAMKGVSHTTKEGKAFALKIMKALRNATDRWKDQTGLGFGLYGTPAESLCYRFARIDRETFGDVPNVTDKGYYTNSYHVDVREHIDVFSKLSFESEFQEISSGGAISYVEMPNMMKNLDAVSSVVSFIYDNIMYAEFNTKSDYCHECGFDGEIIVNKEGQWECPNCGNAARNKLNVTRRTCGYLGENFWNVGKTKEISERVIHFS